MRLSVMLISANFGCCFSTAARHWRLITERRNRAGSTLYPLYFQYLALLFTEHVAEKQNVRNVTKSGILEIGSHDAYTNALQLLYKVG